MKEGVSNVDLLFEQLTKKLAARGEELIEGLKVRTESLMTCAVWSFSVW